MRNTVYPQKVWRPLSNDVKEAWEVYFEAAKEEYNYTVVNSNKLDNKIYILLTVCAFLTPAFYSILGQMKDIFSLAIPVLLCATVLLYGAGVVCLGYTLIVLLRNIRSREVGRIDVYGRVFQRMPNEKHLKVLTELTQDYARCREASIEDLDKRHQSVDSCTRSLIWAILAMLLTLLLLLSIFRLYPTPPQKMKVDDTIKVSVNQEEGGEISMFERILNFFDKDSSFSDGVKMNRGGSVSSRDSSLSIPRPTSIDALRDVEGVRILHEGA